MAHSKLIVLRQADACSKFELKHFEQNSAFPVIAGLFLPVPSSSDSTQGRDLRSSGGRAACLPERLVGNS